MRKEFPENLFQQAFQRASTDEDRRRLMNTKSVLGLSERDEMWAIMIVLDAYTQTNENARSETTKEVKKIMAALDQIPAKASPLAEKAATNAVARVIDKTANQLSKLTVSRSQERADRISKTKFFFAGATGFLLALLLLAIGAAMAWAFLETSVGICAQPPFLIETGQIVCLVERLNRW